MVYIPYSKGVASPPSGYVRKASTLDPYLEVGETDGGRYGRPPIDESGVFPLPLSIAIFPRREASEVAGTSAIEKSAEPSKGGTLRALPRPERLATEYGPHLTHRTVEGLLSLFEGFRDSLGSAAAAVRAAELRARLADAYRQNIPRAETRDFATTISMLQDLLRPHWSQIPAEKIDAVCGTLRQLNSIGKFTPSAITTFYKKVSATLGSGISLDVYEEEDRPGEISQG